MSFTVADLYNDTLGTRPLPSAFAEDSWRRDPRSNPMLLPANSDYEMLAYNEQVQNLADELLKKNQAARAKRQAALLKSLVQQPSVNLFSPPTNPVEAEAQRIVQSNINAGQRGLAIGATAQNRARQLADENLNRRLKIRDQQIQESLLPLQRRQMVQNLDLQRASLSDREAANRESANLRRQQMAQALRSTQTQQQEEDFQNALSLVEQGVHPKELVDAFPSLTREHLMALDAAGKTLAEGNATGFDELKTAAEDFSGRLKESVDQAGTSYEQANKPWFFGFLGGPDQTKLEEQKRLARERALKNMESSATKAGVRYDPTSGGFVPVMTEPQAYEPLDRAMLSRRPSSAVSPRTMQPLPVPADGIPIVRSPQELQAYQDYPTIRTLDGRVRRNPNYRRRGIAIPQDSPVISQDLPVDRSAYYYGWK